MSLITEQSLIDSGYHPGAPGFLAGVSLVYRKTLPCGAKVAVHWKPPITKQGAEREETFDVYLHFRTVSVQITKPVHEGDLEVRTVEDVERYAEELDKWLRSRESNGKPPSQYVHRLAPSLAPSRDTRPVAVPSAVG